MIDEVSDYTDQLSSGNNSVIIDTKQRVLMFALREALLLMVRAIEVYLGLPRTKPPTHR